MPLAPNTRLDRYEILSQLGAGGMGEVYLAEDAHLDRKVALKLLPAEFTKDEDRLRRFVQEAKAASALNHPNILTIYEIGETDGTHYIATEFIDGETLRHRMARTRMSLREVLDLSVQAAGALAAAHKAGIVHRDIKPENIMLREDGYVKVLDFGLAKLTERQPSALDTEAPTKALVNTGAGMVMGTVHYMSPEQARGARVDERTDIWSLGVVLYEMVAGRVPFEGGTPSDCISLILQQEPLPLVRYAPDVPTELERIVTKALRKDREERYQTIKDLGLDLKSFKQRVEFEAEMERSVTPEMRSGVATATSSGPAINATAGEQAGRTADVSAVHPTTSAEYVVSGIRRHKLAAFIALLVVVIAAIGLGFYLHARNSEVAIESIAVLPFENQNRDPNIDYLSDGVTESIINSLTQLPNLRVIARSSVFRYKGKETDPMAAGKELGVRAVLTGRIMQRGDSLTISTELVDVRDNKQIWGEQYNRKVTDALAVQQEISREISERLRTKLSGEEQRQLKKRDTTNPEAYSFYLKGRYYWNKRTPDGYKKGIEYFQQATEKDPNYALAYTGLADCYSLLSRYGELPPREYHSRAKAAAMKALAIDDTLAEAHNSMFHPKLYDERDLAGAERELKRAIELNANYATAHHWYGRLYLAAIGRFDEAIAEMKRAQELDPLSLAIATDVGAVFYYARRYDQSADEYRKALEMDAGFPRAHWGIAAPYEQKRMYEEAIAELQKARRLDDIPVILALLGHAYAVSGKKGEAQKTLDELNEISKRRYVEPFYIAMIYTALGERDRAFQELEKANEARSPWLLDIKVEPRFDSLRSDPRFADLVRRVGLPQ